MFCSSDDDKNGLLLLHTLQSFSEDSEVILCESRRKMRTVRGLDRIVAHSPVSLKKLNRRAHCPKGTLSYSDDTPNTMTRLWIAHPDIRTWERWTLISPLVTKIDNLTRKKIYEGLSTKISIWMSFSVIITSLLHFLVMLSDGKSNSFQRMGSFEWFISTNWFDQFIKKEPTQKSDSFHMFFKAI